MNNDHKTLKLLFLAGLVLAVSGLHLFLARDMEKTHVIARELYFLPIILGAFWFGLRGGVLTALAVTAFYLTYTVVHWQGFSTGDLDRLLELVFFNIVAVIVGLLQDRQKARQREKLEAVRALAATVGHEINSPLFVAMGTLQLLQDEFAEDSEAFTEIAHVRKNLAEVKTLVRRISAIEDVVTRDYDGTSRIVDLDNTVSAK
jgi:signal transduction histidine kinase